jgi:biopolymer transport protein ExbD/biopolymer transport protein TolR
MGFRRRFQESPKIDLTPMVDIVFLLVIFFMISTTFVEQPGVKIDLPEAGSQYLKQSEREVRVYLAGNGDIYLQQEKVTLDQLQQQLSGYSSVVAESMTFILMADTTIQHGAVVQLMDVAKRAGFGHLAIATDEKKKDR